MSRRASSRAAVLLALSCLAVAPATSQPRAALQGGLASPVAGERLAALEDLLLGGRRGGPTLVVRLASLALEDPDARVRELAREVLAGLDSRAGCEALIEVAVALGGEEGAAWITRLPRTPRAQGPLAAAAAVELEPALELAALTTLEHGANGAAVIADIQPITYLHSVAVNWNSFLRKRVVNNQRYKFFWKLVRPIIIRTICD